MTRLLLLLLFAVAMAYLEAMVVVYLRRIMGLAPLPRAYPPDFWGFIHAVERDHPWMIPSEQWREVSTIVMLATLGWLVGRSRRERLGAFLVAFGVWDIFYYAWLKFLLKDWPSSLWERDVLFLIPVTPWWFQPIIFPLVASLIYVALGGWLMVKGRQDDARVHGGTSRALV